MNKFVRASRTAPSRRFSLRSENKAPSGWKLFLLLHRGKIVGTLLVGTCIYFLFYHNRNPILRISFSKQTLQTLYDEALFEKVNSSLQNKGYFKTKLRERGNITSDIKKDFPLVQNIRPLSFSQGTLLVEIQFHQPDFIATTSDENQRIVYRNSFTQLTSGSTIGEGQLQINITLPNDAIISYSGGVFRKIGSQDLVKIIKQIRFLPTENAQFTYYPGWEKLQTTVNNGTFIISLDENALPITFKKRENLIPYMPTSEPYTADLSDPDRIIIKQ